jgi:hypothetical protein
MFVLGICSRCPWRASDYRLQRSPALPAGRLRAITTSTFNRREWKRLSLIEYERRAARLLLTPAEDVIPVVSPRSGVYQRIRANGEIVRYDVRFNRYGTYAPIIGRSHHYRIKTYFRPDVVVHGAPTNWDYFARGY